MATANCCLEPDDRERRFSFPPTSHRVYDPVVRTANKRFTHPLFFGRHSIYFC